MTNKRRTN